VVPASILATTRPGESGMEAVSQLAGIAGQVLRMLRQCAPCGPRNVAPLFLPIQAHTVGRAAVVTGRYLKMNVSQVGAATFECIGFGLGEYASAINNGMTFDVCYTLEENVWRDKRSIQLNIKDIRI